jgi:hypothetical protein
MPHGSPTEKRKHRVVIDCDEWERRTFALAAKTSGISVTGWCRMVLLREARILHADSVQHPTLHNPTHTMPAPVPVPVAPRAPEPAPAPAPKPAAPPKTDADGKPVQYAVPAPSPRPQRQDSDGFDSPEAAQGLGKVKF